jgi:hypothetical protein
MIILTKLLALILALVGCGRRQFFRFGSANSAVEPMVREGRRSNYS